MQVDYKASPIQMTKVLMRQSDINASLRQPEYMLWFAVLAQAIHDLYGIRPTKAEQDTDKLAAMWFAEKQHSRVCALIGLEPDFVVKQLLEKTPHHISELLRITIGEHANGECYGRRRPDFAYMDSATRESNHTARIKQARSGEFAADIARKRRLVSEENAQPVN